MRFQFVLSEIGIGIRRNLAMTISVVLVTFVSLSFVGAAALLQMQVSQLKSYLFNQLQVTVYLCPADSTSAKCADGEVTDDQVNSLTALIESPTAQQYIKEYVFESKEDVYGKVQAMPEAKDNPLLESLTVDDMQADFLITLNNPEQYQVVSDMFSGQGGVDYVSDQADVFDKLIRLLNALTLLSVIVAGVMVVAATLLITTTIRLSAMSRRRETGIMRLVGASNLFIQLPFMLEGAIAATTGALLSIAGLWAVMRFGVEDWLKGDLTFVSYIDSSAVWVIAPFLVIAAIALAAIASIVSLRRYTKV